MASIPCLVAVVLFAAADARAIEAGADVSFVQAANAAGALAAKARAKAALFGGAGRFSTPSRHADSAIAKRINHDETKRGEPGAPLMKAAAGACGSVNCFDPCSNSYRWVSGDFCALVLDPARRCLAASGVCGGGGGSGGDTGSCGTVYCFDPCSGGFQAVRGNSCVTVLDPVRGCARAAGSCP